MDPRGFGTWTMLLNNVMIKWTTKKILENNKILQFIQEIIKSCIQSRETIPLTTIPWTFESCLLIPVSNLQLQYTIAVPN